MTRKKKLTPGKTDEKKTLLLERMLMSENIYFIITLVENAVKFCKHMNKMQANF